MFAIHTWDVSNGKREAASWLYNRLDYVGALILGNKYNLGL